MRDEIKNLVEEKCELWQAIDKRLSQSDFYAKQSVFQQICLDLRTQVIDAGKDKRAALKTGKKAEEKTEPAKPAVVDSAVPKAPEQKKKDWRTDPASLAQKEKLQKLGITASIETLTKGQADVLIKNMSGGAK